MYLPKKPFQAYIAAERCWINAVALLAAAVSPPQEEESPFARRLCWSCWEWSHPRDLAFLRMTWLYEDGSTGAVDLSACPRCRRFFSAFAISDSVEEVLT